MRNLALETRAKYALTSSRVLKSDMRRIYKDQGIHIDLWPYKLKKLRGAYFNDEGGPSVMLAKGLPDDPMIFTMGHELKHHLVDRDSIVSNSAPSLIDETFSALIESQPRRHVPLRREVTFPPRDGELWPPLIDESTPYDDVIYLPPPSRLAKVIARLKGQ